MAQNRSRSPTYGIPGLLTRLLRLNKQAQPYHRIRAVVVRCQPRAKESAAQVRTIRKTVICQGASQMARRFGNARKVRFSDAFGRTPSELKSSAPYGINAKKCHAR